MKEKEMKEKEMKEEEITLAQLTKDAEAAADQAFDAAGRVRRFMYEAFCARTETYQESEEGQEEEEAIDRMDDALATFRSASTLLVGNKGARW